MSRMHFVEKRYYRWNEVLLTSIGQWPRQSSKWQRLQQALIHLEIISVIMVQMIKMFVIWGDVDIMIEIFTPVGVQVAACIKSSNSMINRMKIKTLFEHIQSDWSSLTSERELKILAKFAEDGKTLTITYSIFLFGSMSMYLLIPMLPAILDIIVPLNETREPRYLYHSEHFIDPDKNYYWIALHTYTGTILTIWTIVAVDTMYAAYMQHVCGLLAIVGLEKTSERLNLVKLNINAAIDEDEYYGELVDCIKWHQKAIEFAVLIESTYSTTFLLQLGICMALISVSLLQLLVKLDQYDEMYRLLQFTTAQLFHLFFNSWPGQKLINESTNLRESIYAAGWYGFTLKSRNLIKIAMMAAAAPLRVTASNLYIMSMENFGTVLQTSISYFTVLASLR